MADQKRCPDNPAEFAAFLRERAAGHAPGYDIAIYARPSTWLALADAIVERERAETKYLELRVALRRALGDKTTEIERIIGSVKEAG